MSDEAMNIGDEPSSNVPVGASPAADVVARLTRLANGAANGLCVLGEILAVYPAPPKHPQWSRVVLRALSDDLHTLLAAGQSLTEASEDGSSPKNTVLQPSEGKVLEAVERVRKAAKPHPLDEFMSGVRVQTDDLRALLAEMDKLAAENAQWEKQTREETERAYAEAKAHEVTKGKLAEALDVLARAKLCVADCYVDLHEAMDAALRNRP